MADGNQTGDCLQGQGGMQAPRAHILPPIFQIGEGSRNVDEEMPESHTPQVGAFIVPPSNVVSTSESSVSHLCLAWTHSANETLELISRNIPQMQVEWHTMDPSREEPHVQMTPEAYDHYEQEIVGALVATGRETGQVALFDRESVETIPRTLALHEEAIGALWNYTEWIRKQCALGFDQNWRSHRRVSELLCQVGQCYESIKEHLPQFEQQRADWLLEQLSKIQHGLQNFHGQIIQEMLAVERRMQDFQMRQENTLRIGLEHPRENQIDSAKLLSMHMLLRGLQGHMTVFDTRLNDLKYAVENSLRAVEDRKSVV